MKRDLRNTLLQISLCFCLIPSFAFSTSSGSAFEEPCMECLTAPLLFCPSTYFGCPGDNLDPSLTGTPVALPGDINCPGTIVSYTDTLITDTPCFKKYHRIWKASYPVDSASVKLYSQCVQTLWLEDNEAPELSACPSDITLNLFESCDSTASWNVPTASDNCGIASLSSNFMPGDTFPEGSTQVLYIAEDNCGQRDSCSFQVIVMGVCCENLTLSCPPDTTVCVNSNLDPQETGFAFVSMPDSTCLDPFIFYSDSVLGANASCVNGLIIQRTWFASDSSQTNIYASCIQEITTDDTEAPQIDSLPSDITVIAAGANCSSIVNWSEPVANDSCGILAFSPNILNGSEFVEGTTTIVYAALDYCGNTATASFTITVECDLSCNTPPSVICPPDYLGCPSDSIPPPSLSGTASGIAGDSICADPIISYSDSIVSSGPCPGAHVIERSWIAQDPDKPELADTCVQIITLEDNSAPVINGMPQDMTLSGDGHDCLVQANWIEPTAEDNCEIASFTSNIPNGSLLSEGTTTVVYTAIDGCGLIRTLAFNITVECQVSCPVQPNIFCPPDYWACPTGSIPAPQVSGQATATAGAGGCADPIVSYSDHIISTGPCPLSKIIERKWKATDPDDPSNFAVCTQLLNLEDFQPPHILYCPSNITVNASGYNCSTSVSWNAPLATDNCGAPNLSASDAYGNPVNNGQWFNQGTTQVIYTATDLCGNTKTCQFSVTVNCNNICNTPPTITCPANKTVCPGSSTSPHLLGWAYANAGSYCPDPQVQYQDLIVSTGPCYGEKVISRTWTAFYNNYPGLQSSCVQTIKLKDTQAPVFSYCPPDITVYDTATPVYWNTPQASDNCSSVTMSSTHQPGQYFPLGTTTVNYTAKDQCWNSAYCSFKVTVLNSYNINLDCPDDLYLSCSNGGAYAYWTPPVYEGNCGNCNNNNYIPGFVYMGSLNGHQYYCSTSTATWSQAKQVCESKGGYLASINSYEENEYLANILTLQSAWIGLSDVQSEGWFKWCSDEPLNYTNWYPGQPNDYNGSQDYVEMLNDGQWNDQYNHYSLEYIMELPCNMVNQTAGPAPGSFLGGGSYTVSYEVQDACGGYGSCSFDIIVSGGLSLECPDDIVTSAPANSAGTTVSWELPEANSCCSLCNDNSNPVLPGFVYMGSRDGHDYYCSLAPATWPAAKLACELQGGHLAIIETQEENEFLADLLTLQSAWIGLSDSQSEGWFKWVNGQIPNYTNWYQGQPNNYGNNQDYVEMLDDGQWNDQYNHYLLEYIMEIPSCTNITQTSGPVSGSVLPPGSQHTVSYEVTDACGNITSCSFNIEVQSVNNNKPYCESEGQNSLDYHILSVILGQMNNRSGDDNGYGDYTNVCASITGGQSYALHLTPTTHHQDRIYWKVWMDFNADGDFYDANEMVAYGSGFTTVSGIVTMPAQLSFNKTRMRVIMTPLSYPIDPCDKYNLGETEDYCLSTFGTSTLAIDAVESRSDFVATELIESGDKLIPEFKLYPNPASDIAIIECAAFENIIGLQIHDPSGRLIHSLDSNSINSIMEIDLRNFEAGIYFLSLKHKNGSLGLQKLVISK